MRHTWMGVAAAAVLGVWAVTVGGAGRPADDPARLEEMYQRLDELRKSAPKAADNSSSVTPEGRQIWARISALQEEITRVEMGPEAAERYDEYVRKYQETYKEYEVIWQDKELTPEVRKEREAAVQQKIRALAVEYADAVKKRSAGGAAITERQSRRRFLDALRPLLAVTDEEWKALEPRLGEVFRLRQRIRQEKGLPVAFDGVNPTQWERPNAGTPEGAAVAAAKASGIKPAEVQAKLDALRDTRKKEDAQKAKTLETLNQELKTAQEKVRELVTLRQEAVLVVEGVLD